MRDVAIMNGSRIPNGIHVNDPAPIVGTTALGANERWTGRDEAARIWLTAYSSPNTRNAYQRDITAWFDWCDLYGLALEEARRGDVDAYRSEMEDDDPRPAISTVRRRLAAVSSFYTYWIDEGGLDRNPAAHASRPRASQEPGSIALTRDQALQLLGYVDELPDIRPCLVVRLLLETAMRVSELCAAAVADLGMSSGHRTLSIVRKGGIRATTVLLPATGHAVDVYLQGRTVGPLLATNGCKSGKPGPLDRGYVRDLLRRLAREAGLPAEVVERMHPHVLRHTAAVLLDQSGAPIQVIQRQLGHADPRTTELYTDHGQALEASPVYVLGRLLAY